MIDVTLGQVYYLAAGGAFAALVGGAAAHVTNRDESPNVPFALAAASATVVFLSLARYIDAATPEAAREAIRWQVFGACVVVPAIAWYFARLSGSILSRRSGLLLLGSTALLAVANALSPASLHFASIAAPPAGPAAAGGPLGFVIRPNGGSVLFHGVMMIPLAYCVRYGFVLARARRRPLAEAAFGVSALLAISNVAGTLMDFGWLPRTYVTTLPAQLGLLVLMGTANGVVQRDHRLAQLAADAELLEANRRLRGEVAKRERLEQRLVQTQKMEALGRMAAGVAHDFNNILFVVRGQAELILDRGRTTPEDREGVTAMRAASEQGAGLTRQLLAFTRREEVKPVELSPGRAIGDMLPLLARVAGRDVEVVFDEPSTLPRLVADPTGFEQVIMNLVVNARDAMPGGGRITITGELVRDGAREACACDGGVAGSHVRIRVADTGAGMDADTLARAFEPFFTTKGPDHGTGLGLATVYGIVRQAGGLVCASSRPGAGSTFCVCWPCAPAGAQGPVVPRPVDVRDSTPA